jgi:uncharacterized delta-60 repeat protein
MRRLLLAAICAIAFSGHIASSSAAPGDLRRIFATDGVVRTPSAEPDTDDQMNAFVSLTNGDIFTVGVCRADLSTTTFSAQFCVRKYGANGVPDENFGTAGVVFPFVAANISSSGATDIAVTESGHILVTGWCRVASIGQSFCTVKLSADGIADITFGQGGQTILSTHTYFGVTPSRGYSGANKIHVLPDGRFILAGSCSQDESDLTPKLCLSRQLSSGTLDATFGSGGALSSPFGTSSDDVVTSIVAAANGPIVIVGNSNDAGYAKAFNADGSVLSSFGTQGTVRLADLFPVILSSQRVGNAIADSNGVLLIATDCASGSTTPVAQCVLALDLVSGARVDGFGNQGTVRFSGNASHGFSNGHLALRQDGELIWSGICAQWPNADPQRLCALLLTANGTLVPSFGENTVALAYGTESGGYMSRAFGAAFNKAGAFTMGGSCYLPLPSRDAGFCLAQFHTRQDRYDLDDDNETLAANDGLLLIRYLMGFRQQSLTSGSLSQFAARRSGDDVAAYIQTTNATYPDCDASVVGAPAGPSATLDGLVMLRVLLGLTGDAVTNGINFPQNAQRTSWTAIKTHLVSSCGLML